MRILMLTCNSGLQDGINRHILAIATAINRLNGFEVAVCTTYVTGELNAALEQAAVKTYALNLPHGHDLRTWRRFGEVLRDFRPDVIHAHVIGILERLYLGVICRNIHIVETCHGIADFDLGISTMTIKNRIEKVLCRFVPGMTSRTIFISRGVAIAKGFPNGTVVYNPIPFDEKDDANKVEALHQELGISRDVPLIGTACRISPVKRPHVFVDVMCRVLKALPRAHAVVCGTSTDKSLMAELEKIVINSGVGDRFHWLGYRKDARQIIGELNCFVMTSATEGMPTALLEALSVKAPIAFMRGNGGLVDLEEMNREEGPIGLVADADDSEGLSRQIIGLLNNPSLASNLANRAFAVGRRHFAVEIIRDQLIAVYRSLVVK